MHCKEQGYDVLIDRTSKWGNPFILDKDGTREEVIEKHKLWLMEQTDLLNSLDELKGKRLGCWCRSIRKPKVCHGDLLAELANDLEYRKLFMFDWDPSKLKPPIPITPKVPLSVMNVGNDENREDRILRMLRPLSDTVRACSMCSLGKKACLDKDSVFDPHVFSNMVPSRIFVAGQNPGFNEVLNGEPFVGDSGKYFNDCLKKNGLQRNDFYVTNAVKCYTVGNEKPTFEQMAACEPILRMEIQLLKPLFIITLGAIAFDVFCPDFQFGECRGEFVESRKFGVKVYPVFHPSGKNMSVPERKIEFESNIADICKLIVEYNRNIAQ